MIIGRVTHVQNEREEHYRGVIRTMSTYYDTIRIVRGGAGNGTDYRVLAQFGDEEIEVGAGWNRPNGQGSKFVEIMIDDPMLPAPLYADLVRRRFDDDSYDLEWTRAKAKDLGAV